jgi:hypothetical protein
MAARLRRVPRARAGTERLRWGLTTPRGPGWFVPSSRPALRKVRHYDSRHSSLADLTYCCPTSPLAIFGFLSNEAAPQARLAVVSADRLDPLGCESVRAFSNSGR